MKTLKFFGAPIFFSLFAVTAHAASKPKVLSAKLDTYVVEANQRARKVLDGKVSVSDDKISVILTLDDKKMCVVAPCPQTIDLEFTADRTADSADCGSVVYNAVSDLRRVDGARTEIQVTDNTSRTCRDVRPATEVQIEQTITNRANGGESTVIHNATSQKRFK